MSPAGLLLFGGATRTSTFGSLVDETWLLTDGRWTLLDTPARPPAACPRSATTRIATSSSSMAGFTPDGSPLSDTWEWDGDWTLPRRLLRAAAGA